MSRCGCPWVCDVLRGCDATYPEEGDNRVYNRVAIAICGSRNRFRRPRSGEGRIAGCQRLNASTVTVISRITKEEDEEGGEELEKGK